MAKNGKHNGGNDFDVEIFHQNVSSPKNALTVDDDELPMVQKGPLSGLCDFPLNELK